MNNLKIAGISVSSGHLFHFVGITLLIPAETKPVDLCMQVCVYAYIHMSTNQARTKK